MELQRFREVVDVVRRNSLRPWKCKIASVSSDLLHRSVIIHPAIKNGETELPPQTFLDGNCSIESDPGATFNAELIRIEENEEKILLRWLSGSEPHVGQTLLIFPPDYIVGLKDWADATSNLPPLFHRTTTAQWPNSEDLEPTIPALSLPLEGLRERQIEALQVARKELSLIWGPPGTGKTYTLGAIILGHLLAGRKVLAVGPTNRAVDSLVLSLDHVARQANRPLQNAEVIRLGHPQDPEFYSPKRKHLLYFQYTLEQIGEKKRELETIKRSLEKKIGINPSEELQNKLVAAVGGLKHLAKQQNDLLKNLVQNAKVVSTTLASLTAVKLLSGTPWDVVILDEASLTPASMVAYLFGLDSKQWLFAGDPMQLRPFYAKLNTTNQSLKRDADTLFGSSVFDHMQICPSCGVDRAEDFIQLGVVSRLNEQSRMNESLCAFIGRSFYNGDLKVVGSPPTPSWSAPWPSKPKTIIDKQYSTEPPDSTQIPWRQVREGSPGDLKTAKIIAKLAELLRYQIPMCEKLLVITPFRRQRAYLSSLLAGKEGIEVLTVHRCQGTEARVVLLDPVQVDHRFLTIHRDASRIWNVAISRAQAQVFLISTRNALNEHQHVSLFPVGADIWRPDWTSLDFTFNDPEHPAQHLLEELK